MNLAISTMLIYVGINMFGLLWTAAIIQFGIPQHMRIQDRPKKWSTLLDRLPLVFLNQAILLGLVWIAMTVFSDIFIATTPSVWLVAIQVAIVIVLDDLWFYLVHRLMHENKTLYKKVHRIHHKAYAPLPIEYIYVHPLEWMAGGFGPCFGLFLITMIWGVIPIWTLWGYLLLRNLHELDVHSGIKSPIGNRIPFYGASEHHDLHHAKPTKGNYATTLELWDRVLGTYWRPER